MDLRLSLKYRIAATIVILEAVAMGLVLWATLSLSSATGYRMQATHEEFTEAALANMGLIALVTEEYAELQPYIEQIAKGEDVVSILLADRKNIVVASSSLIEVGQPLPALRDHDGHYWRVREVGNPRRKLGTLAVQFSDKALVAGMRDARNTGIAIAAGGLILFAVLGAAAGFALTRRLGVLTRAAHRLADGETDVRADLSGTDEVAQVGQAFNRMAERIQHQLAELHESNMRFALAVDGSNDGLWDWNISSGYVYYSPQWKEMLGYNHGDIGDSIDEWHARIHPEDREGVMSLLDHYLVSNKDFFTSEHRLQTHGGRYIWVLVRGKAHWDGERKAVRMTGSLTDITERKRQEIEVQHRALHDGLTGLPNRTLMYDRLEQAMLLAKRENKPFSLLVIDLDRFKDVNDMLGHVAGDALLQQVAARLSATLRSADTVSRFGGDEFVVLLPRTHAKNAYRVAQKIHKALEEPVLLDGQRLEIGASIGVAQYPDHGRNVNTMIKAADVAMYTAKQDRLGAAIYEVQQEKQRLPVRIGLHAELRHAIKADELVLHFQPKIDLNEHLVSGVEALVRWQHPRDGLLYPDTFIPVAEHTGLINPLTDWVIEAAIKQQRAWRERGLAINVAVNLSARNLHDLGLPGRIASVLASHGVAPEWLSLEITESAIMAEPIKALKVLTALNQMGITLSVDDFGAGYSSLAYLKRLPVSEIKIDKSFVMEMQKSEKSAAIVRATVDLSHTLGLKAIAEGVENEEISRLLESFHCDTVQGYHYRRPGPAEELFGWIERFGAVRAPNKEPIFS
jgi:diguanylate cyclase (GGDEF)-like protein/PAS domain S-box-containing protein